MFVKCCLSSTVMNVSIAREFQAVGAEMANALSVNRSRQHGVMKSPLGLERSQLSVGYMVCTVRVGSAAQFHGKLGN